MLHSESLSWMSQSTWVNGFIESYIHSFSTYWFSAHSGLGPILSVRDTDSKKICLSWFNPAIPKLSDYQNLLFCNMYSPLKELTFDGTLVDNDRCICAGRYKGPEFQADEVRGKLGTFGGTENFDHTDVNLVNIMIIVGLSTMEKNFSHVSTCL